MQNKLPIKENIALTNVLDASVNRFKETFPNLAENTVIPKLSRKYCPEMKKT
jgi:hypothetical protein